ncbi:MAG: RnfABCDGE type electron transport complex subunit B [Christensenellaceae bacterium]|jgi:electron transport complex protein RnfB|nr:RnfABCDGE type electron transport complex subunit B [Christensenellaceae bacterium]
MLEIIIPLALLGGLGLLFGAGLAFAGQKLAVETDPRVEEVRACLPGAGCGACGYPGCDGYASAVVLEGAATNLCPVGGLSVANEVAKIMGAAPNTDVVRMVATVLCRGDSEHCKTAYVYEGLRECQAAVLASGGEKACPHACIGYGSCQRVCEFGAITVENGLVRIDSDKCMGCRKCMEVCPKEVIRLEPSEKPSILRCRAAESGRDVRDVCSAGCISCGRCAEVCRFGAIEMVNNLPRIDMEQCVGCLECVRVCPTRAMDGDLSKRKRARINYSACVGCTLCKKSCQFDAIEGELRKAHFVMPEKCVGCGACAEKCPRKCIKVA